MTTFETKLTVALESFLGDPPDTEFQNGYLHALAWVGQNYVPTDARVTDALAAVIKRFPEVGDGRA